VSALPSADQALLASVRPFHEREVSQHIWLRTCYRDRDGNSTDAAHEALLEGSYIQENMHNHGDGTLILDDATLYDYGPGGWQRIFNRIPELIHDPYDPESYDRRKAEALEEALESEAAEDEELEEGGYTKSEDGMHWSDHYEYLQYLSARGAIWIADEEALCVQPPKKRKLLIAWFDECGRVVRWNRMRSRHIFDIIGLFFERCDNEDSVWKNAEVGEDYDWDGVCGPPYESESKSESGEDGTDNETST
jgi:hypothetical protein